KPGSTSTAPSPRTSGRSYRRHSGLRERLHREGGRGAAVRVDPSGFSGEDPPAQEQPVKPSPDGVIDVYVHGEKGPSPKPPKDEAEKVGVAVPATDTDPTGSTPPDVEPPEPPEPPVPAEPPEPDDWTQNPYVQTIGGFLGGIGLGIVPFAGTGQQLLDEG